MLVFVICQFSITCWLLLLTNSIIIIVLLNLTNIC